MHGWKHSPPRFVPMRHLLPVCLVVGLSSVFYGCRVGPDYVPPEVELPEEWRNVGADAAVAFVRQPQWWKHFGDPVLEQLVSEAEQENLGLAAAAQRIDEARARYGVTRSELWPNVDAYGAYRRVRSSRNGTNNRVSGFQFEDRDLWTVGGELSWEIDLWGRVGRAMEAARAEVGASIEDYRDVVVILQAEVVGTYISIRSLQESIAVLRANIEIQESSARQAKTRNEAGVVPEIDVTQSETQLATTRAELPAVEIRLESALNRLALLLGKRPGSLHEMLSEPGKIPEVPVELRVPVPAAIVRQRPDIRRAERELAAATARIGVQTAEYFPQLSIFGTFEWESTQTGNLFDADSQAFSIGPFFRWNIFNAGRIGNAVDVETARAKQSLKLYEETVLTALGQVEDALVADRLERQRVEHLTRATTQAKRSVELVNGLYENGLVDYIRVLDAQRAQVASELMRLRAQTRLAGNFVNLYRALGGGWIVPQAEQ